MVIGAEIQIGRERARLNFAGAVRQRFAFLGDYGFTEVESSPTVVRYRKDDLEIGVYHGCLSFEISFGIARQGTPYSLSELIRVADPAAAQKYRDEAVTTPSALAKALARLRKLVSRYGERALQGDAEYFSALEGQRKLRAKGVRAGCT